MDTTRADQAYVMPSKLYMAQELSAKRWALLFSDSTTRRRRVVIAAGDRQRLLQEVTRAKAKFGLPADAPVMSCYEAGRDGFWIHRWLLSQGVDNRVIDSASIEVKQRAKRVKTDGVDLDKLMSLLLRVAAGERDAWHEVRAPTVEQEDQRRLHRERGRLLRERTALGNRAQSLLATQGVWIALKAGFEQALESARCWDGTPLPRQLRAELQRQWQRHQLASEQLRALEHQQAEQLRHANDAHAAHTRELMRLRSVGAQSAWTLCAEVFDWREIGNRRQLGALAGFTPTPYDSGDSQREQGISKAGNARVRTTMIELSWLWLRWQPDSELSRWYMRRFGNTGSKRSRRIGIVALARKLLVALWHYLHDGVIPAGALLKPA